MSFFVVVQTPWILALIFTYCDLSDDSRWRLLLGLGAVPACFVVICSLLEARSNHSQEKADDMSASHALLNPGFSDQFSHHTDGDIVTSKNNRGGATQAPFHAANGTGLLVERKVEDSESSAAREQESFSRLLKERSTWINLLVTGGGWFIYDVAYCKLFNVYDLLIGLIVSVKLLTNALTMYTLSYFRWSEPVWWADLECDQLHGR